MRCAFRNRQKFWYAPFVNKTERYVEDEWGNRILSGEYGIGYGSIVKSLGNISPATGTVSMELFGTNAEYERILIMAGPNCPIDENTILWIDKVPEDETNVRKGVLCGTRRVTDNDYCVKRIARSLHSTAIALSKVSTNA